MALGVGLGKIRKWGQSLVGDQFNQIRPNPATSNPTHNNGPFISLSIPKLMRSNHFQLMDVIVCKMLGLNANPDNEILILLIMYVGRFVPSLGSPRCLLLDPIVKLTHDGSVYDLSINGQRHMIEHVRRMKISPPCKSDSL